MPAIEPAVPVEDFIAPAAVANGPILSKQKVQLTGN